MSSVAKQFPNSFTSNSKPFIVSSKTAFAVLIHAATANAVFDEKTNGFDLEIKEFGNCFATEDMKEGTSAFLEKRKAIFKGS